jgi:hypothetical protein
MFGKVRACPRFLAFGHRGRSSKRNSIEQGAPGEARHEHASEEPASQGVSYPARQVGRSLTGKRNSPFAISREEGR